MFKTDEIITFLTRGLKPAWRYQVVNKLVRKYKLDKAFVTEEIKYVEKEFGILKFHNKGFLFKIGPFNVGGYDFGEYICCFNINHPCEIMTYGGEICKLNHSTDINDSIEKKFDAIYAIHPHIYRHGRLENELAIDTYGVSICLGDIYYAYLSAVKNGFLGLAITQLVSMLHCTDMGEGIWLDLDMPCCYDCGAALPKSEEDNEYCAECEC